MRVRTVQTLCDKLDNQPATRVYLTFPDGRYPVDLCDKHIKELKDKWLPAEAEGTPRRSAGKVATLEQVQVKRRTKKSATATN